MTKQLARREKKEAEEALTDLFDKHSLLVINCWVNANDQPVVFAHLRRKQLRTLIGQATYKREPPDRIVDEETGKKTRLIQVSVTGTPEAAIVLYASRTRKPPLVKVPILVPMPELWRTILTLVPIAEPKKNGGAK